jgi:signal recognition particle subunit SEC65
MIIYPANIDLNLTKKQGRKISRKHAVPSPKAKEMQKVLQGLVEEEVKLEKEKSYSRRVWASEGRVLVDEKGGKTAIMRRIAKEIKRLRSPS